MKKLTAVEKRAIFDSRYKTYAKIFNARPNIIGLDLGTKMTGVYHKSLGSYLIQRTCNNIIERVAGITETFNDAIIRGINRDKSIFVIEDYAYALQASTLSQIAELGGNIKVALFNAQIPYLLVAPPTLKKYTLGPSTGPKTNRNSKSYMLVTALHRWNIKFDDDNLCDAFCLYRFGLAFRAYLKDPTTKKKWEQEMFKQVVISDRLHL